MIDILHQPLAIGDRVVVGRKHGYSGIVITHIVSFTPKKIDTTNGLYYPQEVLKINDQYYAAVQLNPEKFI